MSKLQHHFPLPRARDCLFVPNASSILCEVQFFSVAFNVPLFLNVSLFFLSVPELQGEPEDISKEKARLAAKQVRGPHRCCSGIQL